MGPEGNIRQLEEVLCRLEPDVSHIRRFADDAGVPPGWFKSNAAPRTLWMAVIKAANELGRLPDLVEIVRRHHPTNAELESVAAPFSVAPPMRSLREQVEALFLAGRVGEARKLARQATADELGPIAKVLEPPTVTTRPGSGRGDFIENLKWVDEHRTEFTGRWVALRDGALVDSDRSLLALHKRLQQRSDVRLDELLTVQV